MPAPNHATAEESSTPLFAGVDVGGTNTKIGLLDDAGRIIANRSLPTDEARGPDDAVVRYVETIRALAAHHGLAMDEIAGVGLGTPGSMDIRRGLILEPPNMPHWRNFPIRDRLSELSGKPVTYANDANAAAYGEFWVGSGRHSSSLIMLTLGTGVGGGIIYEGVSIDGVNSFGSECGHIIVDLHEDARLCVWGGGRGELEAYASAPAVVARTREGIQAGRATSLNRRLAVGQELTTLMLAEEAEAGDPFSLQVILETARYLGVAIVTFVHTIDPGAVVIGGAMTFGGEATRVGREFLGRIRQEFRARAFGVVRDRTTIDFASLGGNAGFIGAAGLARAAYHQITTGRTSHA